MVRACCISECCSTKNAPSHKFPKDAQRCMQWYKSLNMVPVEEREKQKLRVCYKHFRESDYSCSPKYRVLVSTAIPLVHVPSTDDINITQSTVNPSVPSQILEVKYTRSIEKQEDIRTQEMSSQLHEVMIQQRKNNEMLSQQQEVLTLQDREINNISLRQEQDKVTLQKEMAHLRNKLDMYLKQSLQTYTRSGLKNISHKSLLTPRARKLYNKIIQLKKEKRHLKRLVYRMKKRYIK